MSPSKRNRRASHTIELLLLLPVLLAVVAAGVEFGLGIAAQQKLTAASALGARVASQQGDLAAVKSAVHAALGTGGWESAVIEANLSDASGAPLPSGADVVVIVTLDAGAVVPDMLGFVGLSLKGVRLTGRTLLRKE